MSFRIDLKSLLIGVMLVLCVLLAVGASSPVIPHHAGRYQLVVADSHNAYVLTATQVGFGESLRQRTNSAN